MATKSKRPRRRQRRRNAPQTPPAQAEQTQAPPAAPAEQQPVASPPPGPVEQEPVESPPVEPGRPASVIRKGIYLSALIYVEGDLPAPDDFISPATNALKSVLGEALKDEHDGLSMTLKKVEVRNDIEQDDEEEEAKGEEQEEKFQF